MRLSTIAFALLAMTISASTLAETTPNKNITDPNEFMQIASDSSGMPSKQCESIAKACLSAGYTRDGAMGKGFWMDCMKPILMGKTITGVTLSPADVNMCRQQKVESMKAELQEMQQVIAATPSSK